MIMERPLDLASSHLDTFREAIAGGSNVTIEGLWDAPKAVLAAVAQQATGKHILVLAGAGKEESRLFHDLRYLTENPVLEFPAWETLPSERLPPSPDVVGERYRVLRSLATGDQPHIIIANLQSVLQKLIPPAWLAELTLTLKPTQQIPFPELIQALLDMGYHRTALASDKGQFSVRGGIIDLFPVNSPEPFRMEFWGDEIEQIRTYDPVSQRSIGKTHEVLCLPAQELSLIEEWDERVTILDYLGKECIILWDDLVALEDRYVSLTSIPGTLSPIFSDINELLASSQKLQHFYLPDQRLEDISEVKLSNGDLAFELFGKELITSRWHHPFQKLSDYLRPIEYASNETLAGDELLHALSQAPRDARLHFLCGKESDEDHVKEQIAELEVALPADHHYHIGYLSSGFAMPKANLIVLPQAEITGRHKIRRQKQRSTYSTPPSELHELVPGDHVVHLAHGVGRFAGVKVKPNIDGVESEYFHVEYANQSSLFIPMTQAHMVSKYVGTQDENVRLHTLGSGKWQKAKARTEKAILGYANDLLDLYAKRQVHGGVAYPPDSSDIERFGDDFPFVETEDQLSAVAAIRSDMLSDSCMDRVVCGDVGYGKTEVAMRAAFKAVVDGNKQVAVLVPTTVLAMQHGETFKERMENFPIEIGVLSRFNSTKQTKELLEKISKGQVDIVIGTHRLISKDVQFKDLGLVVIDEEQRFGVRAKEHLKKVKAAVDCLTLSATPIPRTLHMALVGARDMSVISTPPQDRLPIKTMVAEKSDDLIKNAILRELNRNGQIFFVHNRVETLPDIARHLKELAPQANIIMGHGQMSAEEIDKVFHAFKSGEADILVATTIVESGIDIPNANTIMIDRSDRFGLADLYQLRGRVGRWNRQAYAYFLIPSGRIIRETAEKRLKALAETGGLGGGMRIAMRDLEIRGAGDILGIEQSGHVAAVGFHLYCKMLKRTIAALQGRLPNVLVDTKIEFPMDARLPEEYVNASSLRMEIYQRLGEAISWEDIDEIWRELKDRFGEPPEPAKWLYYVTRVRVWASRHGFTLLKMETVSLLAERKQGSDTTNAKILMKRPSTPADLEAKVLTELKKTFKIKAQI